MVYLPCIVIAGLTYLLYYFRFLRQRYNYWIERGVVGPTPIPIVGNYGPVTFKFQAEGDFLRKLYEDYPNEKYIGIFKGVVPVLVIRDPELIKQVLIIDFDTFNARCIDKSLKIYDKGLFTMNGDESWQIMRQLVSPAFTKSKVTKIMSSISLSLDEYLKFIDAEIIDKALDMEINTLKKKFVLEIVGKLVFGLELNVFSGDADFEKILQKIIKPHEYASIVHTLSTSFPDFFTLVCPIINTIGHGIFNTWSNFIKTLISHCGGKKYKRHSLLDYMADLKEKADKTGTKSIIDNDAIVHQCLTYCLAIYISTSNTMSFLIQELANNQNIQNKCYEEIITVFDKYNGELTYDSVFEMKYLEMVVDETMRKYGLSHLIDRKCTSKYKFLGENFDIDEDVFVYIPLHGLFHDPVYFPNPEVFDPERFSPENKAKIPQCVFIPFGDGPRACIGSRLGKFLVLLGISGFLRKFRVVPSYKTKDKLTYDPSKIVAITALEGVWADIQRR